MISTPFFSLVIPTYNRADLIGFTIQSVLEQTEDDYELIIIDDGSTDNTRFVIQPYLNDKIHYFYQKNSERAVARNLGMKLAKGKYISFLDSDDILYPSYFAYAKESIEKNNFPKFLHTAYEIKNTLGKTLRQVNELKSNNIFMFVQGNPLSCMGCFVHQSLYPAFQFNENRDLSGSEDWELWIRIAANVGIITDNRITSALIDHSNRSVLGFDEQKLAARKQIAMAAVFQDDAVKNIFGKYIPQMESYWDYYIALHLVLSKKKKRGLYYLFAAIRKNPKAIFDRRFLAIIKHCIF